MIISIDSEKVIDKIQHTVMIKVPHLGIESNFLNLGKKKKKNIYKTLLLTSYLIEKD